MGMMQENDDIIDEVSCKDEENNFTMQENNMSQSSVQLMFYHELVC